MYRLLTLMRWRWTRSWWQWHWWGSSGLWSPPLDCSCPPARVSGSQCDNHSAVCLSRVARPGHRSSPCGRRSQTDRTLIQQALTKFKWTVKWQKSNNSSYTCTGFNIMSYMYQSPMCIERRSSLYLISPCDCDARYALKNKTLIHRLHNFSKADVMKFQVIFSDVLNAQCQWGHR